MSYIQQAEQLLTLHGFERGHTVNTVNWWSKGMYEIRMFETGFVFIKRGKTSDINESFPTSDISVLEITIYAKKLHDEKAARLYTKYGGSYKAEPSKNPTRKRKAKRVSLV